MARRSDTVGAGATGPASARPVSRPPHWPEYVIEGAGLATFMVAACAFGTLMEHPSSPVRQALADPLLRRVPMGLAMGLTAIALIYSPLGMRSGAHLNPATTLAFLRLGKVAPADAAGYAVAQVVGAVAGTLTAAAALGMLVAHPAVNFVATVPGAWGPVGAWAAEVAMTFVMMSVVLRVSNGPHPRFTGLCAGALVMTYIVVEAPISGMSLNPARSLGSAVAAGAWPDLWIYLTAPPLGMLLAAELYARRRGLAAVRCAKLHHPPAGPCIFACSYRTSTT